MIDSFVIKMVRLACEMADAQGSTLYLVDGRVLRPYVIYQLPQEYIAGIGEVFVGTQCCGRAVEHKKPWIVEDMLTDPLFTEGRGGAVASPIRAAFSVPVFDGEKVIASLACHFTTPHAPSAVDVERNEAFARLMGIVLRGRMPIAFAEPFFASALDKESRLSE
jgi:GAF domain-containing protein